MNKSYYENRSLPELIRFADANLKQLKSTNKQIESLLISLDNKINNHEIDLLYLKKQ